ncbi:MAG TPA: SpoIIE family protein phosphatase, partial [Acidobacteriota bacterium]|nr:SpoIIE family protein phosphatase [Acidobacteriota bacterium]
QENWKYHPGDDPKYATPELEDHDWTTVAEPWDLPRSWTGTGWFRIHLSADPDLVQVPLALSARLAGSADVYLNGKLLRSYSGHPLFALNPLPIQLNSSDAVLAVRFVNPKPDHFSQVRMPTGITFWISDYESLSSRIQESLRRQDLLIGVMLAFALLHILLFLFHREERLNLYFSILAASIAIMVFTERQDVIVYREAMIMERRLWGVGMQLTALAALGFTYLLRSPKLPRRFPVLAAAGAGLLFWGWNRLNGGWFQPAGAQYYISLFSLILLVEMGRASLWTAFHQPSEGVRILGLGGIPIVLAAIYQMMINFGVVTPLLPIFQMVPLPYYAVLILLISMSVYLSRSFARTNRELQLQLAQVKDMSEQKLEQERRSQQQETERKLLEADHRRKTAELDEARRLQLSMLPKSVPLIPGLEACFYMKTATEVGGDYYDFYRNSPETLTIALGDATGHGMQAGTMVAAAKSLFQNLAHEEELAAILAQMSGVLKRMNFGRMYMALTLARFCEGKVQLACAGMPPPLIYRAAAKRAEEVRLRGIWLGGASFAYEQREIELAPGDTLLMMSDGFPEMFDPSGEMLGYGRAREWFEHAASASPGDLIDRLIRQSETWAGGRPQEDDVTLALVRAATDPSACFPCRIEVSTSTA